MLESKQQEDLRSAMTQRLKELRALIGEELAVEEDERSRQRTGEVGDFGDEPVGADLVRTESALINLHKSEAREIEAALGRLAQGHYGLCVDCGEPIALDRLRAYPTGRRCEPCQRAHENASKRPGRNSR